MNLKRTAAALALVCDILPGTAAFADMKDTGHDTMMNGQQHGRFGGPVYAGQPNLVATASLVAAGGGAADYSTAAALGAMPVKDSLKIATAAGVKLPAAALSGPKLATALVEAGQDSDGAFQIEYLLDKAVSHKIHVQVMNDIDHAPGFGKKADLNYHLISNQAFYDVGMGLKVPNIKLAPLH